VDHDAAVAQGPARRARRLLSYKTVFGCHNIMGELLTIEQVPEPIAEIPILVIGSLEHPVLSPKSPAEVVIQIIAGDLHIPALQILAVEQLNPLLLVGFTLGFDAVRAGKKTP